jgi:Rod binding domain-containing protein
MSLAVGDLVAEVIRNADPARKQEVMARLQKLAPSARQSDGAAGAVVTPASVSFDSVMKDVAGSGQVRNFNLQPANSPSMESSLQGMQDVARDYETLFLQQMLQLVLPEREGDAGANVLSADLARTQLASALASQMATSGDFGIGQQIAQAQVSEAPDTMANQTALKPGALTPHIMPSHTDGEVRQHAVLTQPDAVTSDSLARNRSVQLPDVIAALWSRVENVLESVGGTTRAVDRLERTR